DKALKDNGFTYKSTVCVKNDYFPDREYGEYFFPAGYYDALMIYLGDGVGDNWWCVAFPPLCFVPSGEDVVYKSWVKEKLDDIFGKK
ncbi:MAG: stage II sporulation protein R, partial [Clostridia bacterium]|nr:stage II sporulation protein R [Clostridia bacterium]